MRTTYPRNERPELHPIGRHASPIAVPIKPEDLRTMAGIGCRLPAIRQDRRAVPSTGRPRSGDRRDGGR